MAAFANAHPGYVASFICNTHLLGLKGRGAQWSQSSCLTAHSLPMLEYVQRVWEGSLGQYPVTTAFLKLIGTLVTAGVNEACVKVHP